jgi:purine-binding chemotaxis protein CheW
MELNQIEMQLLEKRGREIARPLDEKESIKEMIHLVEFAQGSEHFGIEVSYVYEIQPLKKLKWSLVPCTPTFIVGAVNIRGRIYSMMDIGCFMGLPERTLQSKAQAILVKGGKKKSEMALCILADDVPKVRHIPISDLQNDSVSLSGKTQEFARGVSKEMLIILDMDRLLADPGIVVDESV